MGHPFRAFIAFKLREACSSDCPPDKKVTPGSAGTMVRDRVLTVIQAISWGVERSLHSAPGVTMLGLRRSPSIKRCWLKSSCMTAVKTLSETEAHTLMSWSPSYKISGSIIGTSPFCWQIDPYLAREWAVSRMAISLGQPLPILRTALHLANLQPIS